MNTVNIILVYSRDMARILMCRRRKPPYQGLLNLVGGHMEPGEDALDAAYRELFEETGIARDDIRLSCVIRSEYPLSDIMLEMYAGRLSRDVDACGDENELVWVDVNADFFDTTQFAGHGNIGHLVAEVREDYADIVFGMKEVGK